MRTVLIVAALGLAACTPAAAPGTGSEKAMEGMGAEAPAEAPVQGPVRGMGVVTAIDATSVTLNHEAIAAIGWPAMIMRFNAENPAILEGVRVGDRVAFELKSATATGTIVKLEKQ